ncbi:MAG: IS6 family transposase [Nitrospira sp. CG24A]|nr:MAG: IS6 family transposase [Nitrospira sp. CG24A]
MHGASSKSLVRCQSVVRQAGCKYSKRLRRCRGPVGDTWHLDEKYLKTNGQFQYLWRAVDLTRVIHDASAASSGTRLRQAGSPFSPSTYCTSMP